MAGGIGPILNRSKTSNPHTDWIDPKEEILMHPVNILLDEIYHDYWGIPGNRKTRVRRSGHVSLLKRARKQKS
jgi:hypothetical protein